MTSRRSPPESKAPAKPVQKDRPEEGEITGPAAMERFRKMAKKVISVPVEKVREIEQRERKR